MPSEKSEPTTDAPREASSIARSPVPVATSSAREPGPTRARSAARSRQRWCSPAVMTEFMRSYGPAMRSNIARTCPSSRVPLRAPALMRRYSPLPWDSLSCERNATSCRFFSGSSSR